MTGWSGSDWDAFFRLLTMVFAPFWGSFLALFAARWPAGAPIAVSRSRCAHCGRVLGAGELVPILSWLTAGGRCRGCGAAIGFAPLAFELGLLGLGVLLALSPLAGARALLLLLAGGLLIAIAVIDARHLIIPRTAALVVLAAGLIDGVLAAGAADPQKLLIPPQARLIGAGAGFLTIMLARAAYHRLRGREGLGAGDAWLLAAIGAWTGWRDLAAVVAVAAVLALAFVAGRALVTRRRPARDEMVPFGPFLALAAAILLAQNLAAGGENPPVVIHKAATAAAQASSPGPKPPAAREHHGAGDHPSTGRPQLFTA